jgi:uncharacterized protein (DUF1330 family)
VATGAKTGYGSSKPKRSGEEDMPKAYWIARVDVHDPDAYKSYVAANAEAFTKFGARFIVRGGPFEVMEGAGRSRNVVIEFDSYDQAIACYKSPEYMQKQKACAMTASDGDLIIIRGVRRSSAHRLIIPARARTAFHPAADLRQA